MAASVEAVLFDLDDTLCEYRRSGGVVLDAAFERAGVEPFFTVTEYHARYDEFAATTDSIEALRAECFAALAAANNEDPALGRQVAARFADERDQRNVRALPGAREAVATLADEHRLGVVTNGAPEMQATKLDALEFGDAFETVVHAGYDAPAKPDPEPFHRALDALDGIPDSAVHVGNSLVSDVPGTRAAGLRSAWLDDGSDLAAADSRPDYTLDSMAALCDPPWNTG